MRPGVSSAALTSGSHGRPSRRGRAGSPRPRSTNAASPAPASISRMPAHVTEPDEASLGLAIRGALVVLLECRDLVRGRRRRRPPRPRRTVRRLGAVTGSGWRPRARNSRIRREVSRWAGSRGREFRRPWRRAVRRLRRRPRLRCGRPRRSGSARSASRPSRCSLPGRPSAPAARRPAGRSSRTARRPSRRRSRRARR